MKHLPNTEKPYEKCKRYGPEILSDAELLAVILRTGTKGEKAVDLANQILSVSEEGILNIEYLALEELTQIKGVGIAKGVSLKCVAELSKRLAERSRKPKVHLNHPESIANYYMERLRHCKKEQLIASFYNTKNRLISDIVISVGTSNASLISPSEIFRSAILSGGEYIVLLHNHPSGDPTPSREDIRVTMQIKEAGLLLGIGLMDHIIIGDHRYYSFREENQL